MYLRIKDAAVEIEEHDSNIAALTVDSQIDGEQHEFLELYYQCPMTWLTYVANLNPDDDKPNNGFDKREFRRKRRLNTKAMVDKKKKCMEKLLKSIAKRKGETKIVPDESAEMKACATQFEETEISIIYLKDKEVRNAKEEKSVKLKQSKQRN